IKNEMKRYETVYSAIIPALYQVQREKGWVPPEAVPYLAGLMGLPEAHINEVLYFYTMFNKKPVGKLHVQVCTNISCAMNGGRELADALCRHFNVKYDDVSGDVNLTISRVEWLDLCGSAPIMQVNNQYI